MNILGDGQEIRVSSCSEWNEFYARLKWVFLSSALFYFIFFIFFYKLAKGNTC